MMSARSSWRRPIRPVDHRCGAAFFASAPFHCLAFWRAAYVAFDLGEGSKTVPGREHQEGGRISPHTFSASPRSARNKPSTTPSSRCCPGVPASRQRSAACSTSATVSSPTAARSVRASACCRPGGNPVSGHGWPSAASPRRMPFRHPQTVLSSGAGLSSSFTLSWWAYSGCGGGRVMSASSAKGRRATAQGGWRAVRGCKPE